MEGAILRPLRLKGSCVGRFEMIADLSSKAGTFSLYEIGATADTGLQ